MLSRQEVTGSIESVLSRLEDTGSIESVLSRLKLLVVLSQC